MCFCRLDALTRSEQKHGPADHGLDDFTRHVDMYENYLAQLDDKVGFMKCPTRLSLMTTDQVGFMKCPTRGQDELYDDYMEYHPAHI